MKPTKKTLQVGQTLRKRYEIKGLLGAGGMGAVYRAYDHLRQRELALKQLHDHLTPETSRRLLQELSLQEQIGHAGVVRTYDADQDPDTDAIFFTMALVEGPSLEDLLQATRRDTQQAPFSLPQIARLLETLASILHAVHQKGILHGDIKPSHVLFGQTNATGTFDSTSLTPGHVATWLEAPMYLIDFGLARPLTFSMLPTGGAGTPPIMAPEQWQPSAPLTPATDVYALGLLLYRLLTGAPHTGGQLPPPSAWLRAHGLPTWKEPLCSGLDQVVATAIAYLPADRYPDAIALCNDFTRVLAQQAEADAAQTHVGTRKVVETVEEKGLALQTNKAMASVALDPNVQSLDLSGEAVSLATLEALAGCVQLRRLTLNDTGLRDSALVYLASLDTLETLECADNAISGEGLCHIAQLPNLRMLSLSHNPLRPGNLQALASTKELRWLSLWGCPVDRQDLEILARMGWLETLHLSETPIDDEASPLLEQMTHLQSLVLHRTRLSPTAFERLQVCLPKCHIQGE